MNFSEAEERFRELKRRFAAGDLTEIKFKAQLEDLMVEDEAGNWWMLGYETERWYRHDGTSWVQADPPTRRGPEPSAVAAPEPEKARPAKMEAAVPVKPGPAQLTAAPRRSPVGFAAAALIVLAAGAGFFILSSGWLNPAAAPEPTAPPATEAPISAASPESTSTSAPEPTLEPSQTPTPGVEFLASAASSQVILYQGPDLKYGQVKSYPKGEMFVVLARDADAQWLLVRASDGNEGWVYFQWIDSDFDLSLVPTPSVLPPPPPTATRKPKDNKPTPCSFGC